VTLNDAEAKGSVEVSGERCLNSPRRQRFFGERPDGGHLGRYRTSKV